MCIYVLGIQGPKTYVVKLISALKAFHFLGMALGITHMGSINTLD